MRSLGQRRRTSGDVDVEIDMVPVMNMFLVLIPFLLMSSSFLHLKVINTSVPVKSNEVTQQQPPKSDIKLTVVVALATDNISLTASSEELTEDKLKVFDKTLPKKDKIDYPFAEFTEALVQIKRQYPKSDTVIIMPDDDIKYNDIIKIMDAARQYQLDTIENSSEVNSGITKTVTPKIGMLFPNVVLSSKAG
jgi:biopolymer transport protein ExbD